MAEGLAGIVQPEEALARARLADAIGEVVQRRGLNQTQAAEILGVDQPTVSKVINGRLEGGSPSNLSSVNSRAWALVWRSWCIRPGKKERRGE